ncbi:hypothetical protein H4582DRAFT_1903229 [Lactarius indigo]|nr:hypothetical protein H4582DRAFT_1903229 [Lactarius indigo]
MLLWLRDYFQLDVDLVKLYSERAERDPVFCKSRTRFEGIRMLRQDPWENLVSCTPTVAFLSVARSHPLRSDSYTLRTTTLPASLAQRW